MGKLIELIAFEIKGIGINLFDKLESELQAIEKLIINSWLSIRSALVS
jgi:hypothetical protein